MKVSGVDSGFYRLELLPMVVYIRECITKEDLGSAKIHEKRSKLYVARLWKLPLHRRPKAPRDVDPLLDLFLHRAQKPEASDMPQPRQHSTASSSLVSLTPS